MTFFACFIPAPGGAGAESAHRPSPAYLVDRLGLRVEKSAARSGIDFAPFLPPRHTLAFALLPPFHGDDERRNRGLGIEYADESGRRYVLAQWPANGGRLTRYTPLDESDPDCPNAYVFRGGATPSGIVWSTPHGRIVSLAADGKNDARTVRAEWKRLIRRGACR